MAVPNRDDKAKKKKGPAKKAGTSPAAPALPQEPVAQEASGAPAPSVAVAKEAAAPVPAGRQAESLFAPLTDYDVSLFKVGKHYHLYRKLGAHQTTQEGEAGVSFAVWAPNATFVAVVGHFNSWDRQSHPMTARPDGSGIWELFIPGIGRGEHYKYYLESHSGYRGEKGDPYAFHWENPPATASVVWDIDYEWQDSEWMADRMECHPMSRPMSIYEVHIGSWRRVQDDQGSRYMTYRELATDLPAYCREMGFTHVELMPVMEHPFYGSWGYQITGYFAPSSRFGTPQDFMFLIDALHAAGIGVILDWVPSHFPTDEHGLGFFDGTHLYEHDDPRKGFHPDWKSWIFDYTRNEVRAFLISNALYWLDKYHIDGLRVDAVASMLYLDYSREWNEWIPNQYGGRENLEAISFLKEFNDAVHLYHPHVFTVAEESTAWPHVTGATSAGGLGFDMKWMMGWMHDSLKYFAMDPLFRGFHQGQLSFSIYYAFSEKFVLPLSHDEVVHLKGSLINKMPGDNWQQFANLRLLFAYMYGHPGAKMIFMGGEFAQRHEWQHDYSLDWHELGDPYHRGVQRLLSDLNGLYRREPALYERNFSHEGFEWIDFNDAACSTLSWIRKGRDEQDWLVIVANFTPVVRENFRIGVPALGTYREIFNSDDTVYMGSGMKNESGLETAPIPRHGQAHSLSLVLPPLGLVVLKREAPADGLPVPFEHLVLPEV